MLRRYTSGKGLRAAALAFVLIALAHTVPILAQSLEGGARSVALAGASTSMGDDAWGHTNPAAWSTLARRSLAVFVSEAYGLPELRLTAAQVAYPLPFGTVAVGARTFGFSAYRDTHFNFGVARAFRAGTTRSLHLGLNTRYHMVAIERYGSSGALGISLGALVGLTPVLNLGFHALNVNRPKLAGREAFGRSLALGLGYHVGERILLVADVIKDVRYPLAVRVGLESYLVPQLAVRVGSATAPNRFTTGLGLRLGRWTADFALERHQFLGWSPALSMSMEW